MNTRTRSTPKRGGNSILNESSPEKRTRDELFDNTPSKAITRQLNSLRIGQTPLTIVDVDEPLRTRSASRQTAKKGLFVNKPARTEPRKASVQAKMKIKILEKPVSPKSGDDNMETEDEEQNENRPPVGYATPSLGRPRRRNAAQSEILVESTPATNNRLTRTRAGSQSRTTRAVAAETATATTNDQIARRTRSTSRSRGNGGITRGLLSDEEESLLLSKTPVRGAKLTLKYEKVAPPTLRLKKVENGYKIKNQDSPFVKSPARVLRGEKKTSKVLLDIQNDSDSGCSETSSSDSNSDQSIDSDDDMIPVPTTKRTNGRRTGAASARSSSRSRTAIKSSTHRKVSPRKKTKPQTLEDLRSCLHTSEVPENMPCREEEYGKIRNFITSAVEKNGASQAMYISGVPGTGKTATTLAVVNELSQKFDFKFVPVNAMELIDSKLLFVTVYREVTGDTKRISAQAARRKLNAMFEMIDRKREPVVVLVDELDMLCTKKQEIIYDIFNWTVVESARVSVIAIANTLDLPERMLSQRITSRLGSNRICFQPYEFQQIEEIIMARLQEAPHAISSDAVQFAARKVAAISGDLRKAMDILRRAIEIAVEKGDSKLEMKHVNDANREAAAVPRVSMVMSLPRHAFVLFRAAISQVQSSGLEEFTFHDLYRQYTVLCTQLEGVQPYFEYGLHALMMRMCSNRLLIAAPGGNFMSRKVRLGMTTQEAQFAIKQTETAKESHQIQYTF